MMAVRNSVKNNEIIFVSGYAADGRPDPDVVKEYWWKLQSYIHNLSQRHQQSQKPDKFCVMNKSSLRKVNTDNVNELQQMLLEMPLDGAGITRIIIAHSHGASIVYDALKEASLITFLKAKGIREPNEKIKQIRCQLAVFTLGGIQDIPKAFAKISWNLLFTTDLVAKTGTKVFAEKHRLEANRKEFGIVDAAFDKAVNIMSSAPQASSYFQDLMKYKATPGTVISGALATVFSSAVSLASAPHYIKDYVASDEIMKAILRILEIEDDGKIM